MTMAREQRKEIRARCEEQIERRSAGSPITARGTIVLLDTLDEMESDRDSWKAKAEALIQAIKSSDICSLCAKEDACDDECYDYHDFELDDVQLAKEKM